MEDSAIIDIAQWADTDLPLAGWYAEPMDTAQAAALERQAGACLRRPRAGAAPLPCRLQWLVARFWRGRDIGAEADNLLAVTREARARALVFLVHGQLLASVRRAGAMERLDQGFALAANLLEADAYFRVLRRHETLRVLPWHAVAATPQGLDALLREAAVIRRLRGPGDVRPRGTEGAHLDTLD